MLLIFQRLPSMLVNSLHKIECKRRFTPNLLALNERKQQNNLLLATLVGITSSICCHSHTVWSILRHCILRVPVDSILVNYLCTSKRCKSQKILLNHRVEWVCCKPISHVHLKLAFHSILSRLLRAPP